MTGIVFYTVRQCPVLAYFVEKLQIQIRSQFRQAKWRAMIPMSKRNGTDQERIGCISNGKMRSIVFNTCGSVSARQMTCHCESDS